MAMLPSPIDDTAERLAAFEASLQTVLGTRLVEPGFTPAGLRSTEDLLQGVVNVVTDTEIGYGEGLGLTAIDANTRLLLICHLQVTESTGCDRSALSEAVRAAELALLAEIKTFCRTPVDGLEIVLLETAFSRQLEAPMGWLVVTIEMRPPAASVN